MSKRKGSVGGSCVGHLFPGVDKSVLNAFFPPAKSRPKRKPVPRKLIFTDEEVLLIRTKAEYEGYTCRDLAEAFDVDYDYMYRLLTYQVRSKLVPKRPESV